MALLRLRAVLVLLPILVMACTQETSVSPPQTAADVGMSPPVAQQQSYEVTTPHGATRQDEYYWLRDDTRQNPEMLAYLNAENAYADAVMKPLQPLKERLYAELTGRIKQDEASVPYRYKGYWYYTRYEEGKEYPVYARRKGSMQADEEILLDLNVAAQGYDFYSVANGTVSPDNQYYAFLEDTVGRRQFSLQVKDLISGKIINTGLSGLGRSFVWSADSKQLYYIENDPETLLAKRVKSYRLGTNPAESHLIYEEPDDSFYMGIGLTRSEKYFCIFVSSTVSSEQRCTTWAEPGAFHLIAPRERDFKYQADHLGDRWVIRTNWQAPNFRLMQAADGSWEDRKNWTDIVPHDDSVFISRFELFDDFIAIDERSGGLTRIRLLPNEGESEYIAADESAYAMSLDYNSEPNVDLVRYTYTSLTTPTTTYELNVKTGERDTLKEEPVLGGFDKNNYVTERLWATAHDGTRIPVSVLYRKGFKPDGTAALLQYGYGSYGLSMEPWFDSNIISLVDRGMVYAIAHVRGGQEMGRYWYEDGKLLNKMNTFTDFIDVTRYLVAQGYAAPDRVAAMGASAGGLLMGAVTNLAPEKYRVIVALVPFVDVVTTMLDESIPLTTNEFDEWGNPKDPVYYAYMLSYSPYDQLAAQDYPAIYVGTGLWDSQVQYWEPAKYVARLRARRTDDDLIVLRTQMEAGHGGRSGRFQQYQQIAEYYAFLINQLGVGE